MQQPKFAQGDVVRLKSGGPKMTVEYVLKKPAGDFYGSYKCLWFDESNKQQRQQFVEATLEPANDAPTPSITRTTL